MKVNNWGKHMDTGVNTWIKEVKFLSVQEVLGEEVVYFKFTS